MIEELIHAASVRKVGFLTHPAQSPCLPSEPHSLMSQEPQAPFLTITAEESLPPFSFLLILHSGQHSHH